MRVRRSLPPAAAPLSFRDLLHGFKGFLAGHPRNEEFEKEFKTYFNVRHVFFTSSGKACLYLILKALKSLMPARTEVLIPAYTCFSVPSAIIRSGLTVALCDIDPSSLDFDRAALSSKITKETLCVIPNHLFGIPSGIDDIMAICRGKNVFVLEDAAQAMGCTDDGRFLGTIGDAGFFSLGRGKSVTCGSGGIIVTNSDPIAAAIKKEYELLEYPGRMETVRELIKTALMSLFIRPHLYWIPAAIPFLKLGRTLFDTSFPVKRLSPMQRSLCTAWRSRLEKAILVRRRQAAQLLSKLEATRPAGVSCAVTYLRLPVIMESRKQKRTVCRDAKRSGLGITPMYPCPIHEIPQIADCFTGLNFPAASLVADRLITIPLHKFVKDRDREEIVRLITAARGRNFRDPARLNAIAAPIPGFVAAKKGHVV